MKDEEFLSLAKEAGLLFKLPIEDTFPVSSHGIAYSTMMLTSSPKNSSEEAFLSAIHAIVESDKQAFTNVEKEIVNWNHLDTFGKIAIHYASVAGWNRSRVLGANYIASKGEIPYLPGADWNPSDKFSEYAYMKIGGSFFILQSLIEKKVDLLIKDSQGWTALHYAAAVGNYIALVLLLKAEKKLLNIPALNRETPLYLAVQKNRLSCVRMLLGFEADLSVKSMHGWNVLMSAIHNGHEEMALFLVKTGKMDLEYAWRGGKTALHFAIEMEMEELLEELLRLGVDRNRIYNGQMPISLANAQNWQKGVELLGSSPSNTENQNSGCLVM